MIIDPVLFGLFLGATVLFIASPGPIVSLIIAETLRYGPRPGVATALGAGLIACLFLGIYLFGAASLFSFSEQTFIYIRYLGAIYLGWLAIGCLRASRKTFEINDTSIPDNRDFGPAFKKALVIGITNPKTILFFAAFFPQFISHDLPLQPQLYVLTATFLTVSVGLDLTWVFAASRAREFLVAKGGAALVNRLAGIMLLAGALLLLVVN